MIVISTILLFAIIDTIIFVKKGKSAILGLLYVLAITILSLSLLGFNACLICSVIGIIIAIIMK